MAAREEGFTKKPERLVVRASEKRKENPVLKRAGFCIAFESFY